MAVLHIISKKKMRDYYQSNAQAKIPLTEWYHKMMTCQATNINDLRAYFNSADPVNGYTIFNIGGNNYRLITAIHYNSQRCYIREIWTHEEYDKKANLKKLQEAML